MNGSWPNAAVVSLSMLLLTLVLTPIGWIIQRHWIARRKLLHHSTIIIKTRLSHHNQITDKSYALANVLASHLSYVSGDTNGDLESAVTLEENEVSNDPDQDLEAAVALEGTAPA